MGSLFVLRKSFGFAVTICTLIFSVFAHASPSHDWLLSQQSAEGAFENSAPISTAIQSTHEVLTTLTLESISSPVKIPLALDYLSTADTSNTEVLARVITAQAASGNSAQPLILELSARQNIDGGFGAYLHYESDPLSTAFALPIRNSLSLACFDQ